MTIIIKKIKNIIWRKEQNNTILRSIHVDSHKTKVSKDMTDNQSSFNLLLVIFSFLWILTLVCAFFWVFSMIYSNKILGTATFDVILFPIVFSFFIIYCFGMMIYTFQVPWSDCTIYRKLYILLSWMFMLYNSWILMQIPFLYHESIANFPTYMSDIITTKSITIVGEIKIRRVLSIYEAHEFFLNHFQIQFGPVSLWNEKTCLSFNYNFDKFAALTKIHGIDAITPYLDNQIFFIKQHVMLPVPVVVEVDTLTELSKYLFGKRTPLKVGCIISLVTCVVFILILGDT